MKHALLIPSSLALRNARHAGRMSERGNCFPFLRKVNGSRSRPEQFRRLMEDGRTTIVRNARRAVFVCDYFTGTVTQERLNFLGDRFIDETANSARRFSARARFP